MYYTKELHSRDNTGTHLISTTDILIGNKNTVAQPPSLSSNIANPINMILTSQPPSLLPTRLYHPARRAYTVAGNGWAIRGRPPFPARYGSIQRREEAAYHVIED